MVKKKTIIFLVLFSIQLAIKIDYEYARFTTNILYDQKEKGILIWPRPFSQVGNFCT